MKCVQESGFLTFIFLISMGIGNRCEAINIGRRMRTDSMLYACEEISTRLNI